MSAEGGTKAVLAALGANLGIAAMKFVAFGFTGSTSMMAEGVHSLADSGNQALLIFGRKRSERARSREHPFGYGRERFFWSLLAALVIPFGDVTASRMSVGVVWFNAMEVLTWAGLWMAGWGANSVLSLVVTDTLFKGHPDLPEGQLAKLRAAVVQMNALAEVARDLRLGSD